MLKLTSSAHAWLCVSVQSSTIRSRSPTAADPLRSHEMKAELESAYCHFQLSLSCLPFLFAVLAQPSVRAGVHGQPQPEPRAHLVHHDQRHGQPHQFELERACGRHALSFKTNLAVSVVASCVFGAPCYSYFALTDIAPLEDLTVDYHYERNPRPGGEWPFVCLSD